MLRWFVSRGWHGWVVVAIFVVAFDVAAAALGGETMTDATRRWFHRTPGQWFVVPVMVYLVVHLTVMPWRFDPLDRTFVWLRRTFAPVSRPVEHPVGKYPDGKG